MPGIGVFGVMRASGVLAKYTAPKGSSVSRVPSRGSFDQAPSLVSGNKVRVYEITADQEEQLQDIAEAVHLFNAKRADSTSDQAEFSINPGQLKRGNLIIRDGDNIFVAKLNYMVGHTCAQNGGDLDVWLSNKTVNEHLELHFKLVNSQANALVISKKWPELYERLLAAQQLGADILSVLQLFVNDPNNDARAKGLFPHSMLRNHSLFTNNNGQVPHPPLRSIQSVRQDFAILALHGRRIEEIMSMFDDSLSKFLGNFPQGLRPRVWLVMGKTGDGKSSLINYYAGCKPVLQTRKEGRKKINYIEFDNPIAQVGSHRSSCTKFPETHYVEAGDFKVGFCDCTGLGDTGGYVAKVVNAVVTQYAIEQLRKQCNLSLLITISSDSLLGGKFDLSHVHTWLQRTFGDNYASMNIKSVTFVITKGVKLQAMISLLQLQNIAEQAISAETQTVLQFMLDGRYIICDPLQNIDEQHTPVKLFEGELPSRDENGNLRLSVEHPSFDFLNEGGVCLSNNALDNSTSLYILTYANNDDPIVTCVNLSQQLPSLYQVLIEQNMPTACEALATVLADGINQDMRQLSGLEIIQDDTTLGITITDDVVNNVTQDLQILETCIRIFYSNMIKGLCIADSMNTSEFVQKMLNIITASNKANASAKELFESSKRIIEKDVPELQTDYKYAAWKIDIEVFDRLRPLAKDYTLAGLVQFIISDVCDNSIQSAINLLANQSIQATNHRDISNSQSDSAINKICQGVDEATVLVAGKHTDGYNVSVGVPEVLEYKCIYVTPSAFPDKSDVTLTFKQDDGVTRVIPVSDIGLINGTVMYSQHVLSTESDILKLQIKAYLGRADVQTLLHNRGFYTTKWVEAKKELNSLDSLGQLSALFKQWDIPVDLSQLSALSNAFASIELHIKNNPNCVSKLTQDTFTIQQVQFENNLRAAVRVIATRYIRRVEALRVKSGDTDQATADEADRLYRIRIEELKNSREQAIEANQKSAIISFIREIAANGASPALNAILQNPTLLKKLTEKVAEESLKKAVPFVGLVFGIFGGIYRMGWKGEIKKGFAEIGAGAASTWVGLGTVASITVSVCLIADDIWQAHINKVQLRKSTSE